MNLISTATRGWLRLVGAACGALILSAGTGHTQTPPAASVEASSRPSGEKEPVDGVLVAVRAVGSLPSGDDRARRRGSTGRRGGRCDGGSGIRS